MSGVTIASTNPESRKQRIDAEYYASPLQADVSAMFSGSTDWHDLSVVSDLPTSGGTPSGHDLATGTVPFITIDGIEPLWLDVTRSKRVTEAHRERELKRVRLRRGDVVVTIKRRICNAAVVGADAHDSVVNQDVAVLRPTDEIEPEVLAACLVSRPGQSQAKLLQTEQINPYLSVTSLKRIRIPALSKSVRESVVAEVSARTAELAKAEAETARASALVREAFGIDVDTSSRVVRTTLGGVKAASRLDAEFFTNASLTLRAGTPFTTLGEYTHHLGNGATPASDEYVDDGYPIFKVGGLTRFGVADWLGDRVARSASAARAERARARAGDVLILAAAHDTRYIGKSAVIQSLPPGEAECRVVGEVIVARPREQSGATLAAYLNVPGVRREMQRLVRGQSAHLYPTDLSALPVPVFAADLIARVESHFDASRTARLRSEEHLKAAKTLIEEAVFGV